MSEQPKIPELENWGELPKGVEVVTEADETEQDVPDMDEFRDFLAQTAEEQGFTDDEGNDEDQAAHDERLGEESDEPYDPTEDDLGGEA